MKKTNSGLNSILLVSTLIAGVSSCGSSSDNGVSASAAVAQKKSLSDSIRFAKAAAHADGIELALRIDGSKSQSATGGALDTPDVILLQGEKDGKIAVVSVAGMDIRGEGLCLDADCKNVKVSLNVNESGFESDAAELLVTISTKPRCGVKSLAAAEDALFLGLKKSLNAKVAVSMVEKASGTSKYFAIAELGTQAIPFFRADLQPESDAHFELIELDASGTLSTKPVAVKIESAEINQAPYSVKTVLSHEGQPSTEMLCSF